MGRFDCKAKYLKMGYNEQQATYLCKKEKAQGGGTVELAPYQPPGTVMALPKLKPAPKLVEWKPKKIVNDDPTNPIFGISPPHRMGWGSIQRASEQPKKPCCGVKPMTQQRF